MYCIMFCFNIGHINKVYLNSITVDLTGPTAQFKPAVLLNFPAAYGICIELFLESGRHGTKHSPKILIFSKQKWEIFIDSLSGEFLFEYPRACLILSYSYASTYSAGIRIPPGYVLLNLVR